MCTITTLSRELVDYIYRYADHFKTAEEKLAAKTVLYHEDVLTSHVRVMLKRKGWYSDEPQIKAMIADGFDAFKKRVAERIYHEHRNELNLNVCPRCNKLARTPFAKQCRHCYYSWHEIHDECMTCT